MKIAEIQLPTAVIHITVACNRGEKRSHVKIHTPMNVDSRKNARSPSSASGAPKTSPTYAEYVDQFMPNWNSCTMPVTTPIATLMTKIRPQNSVIRRHAGSFVRAYTVSIAATTNESPRVTGTKM